MEMKVKRDDTSERPEGQVSFHAGTEGGRDLGGMVALAVRRLWRQRKQKRNKIKRNETE